jgi:hypothetical protein
MEAATSLTASFVSGVVCRAQPGKRAFGDRPPSPGSTSVAFTGRGIGALEALYELDATIAPQP